MVPRSHLAAAICLCAVGLLFAAGPAWSQAGAPNPAPTVHTLRKELIRRSTQLEEVAARLDAAERKQAELIADAAARAERVLQLEQQLRVVTVGVGVLAALLGVTLVVVGAASRRREAEAAARARLAAQLDPLDQQLRSAETRLQRVLAGGSGPEGLREAP